MNIYARVLLIFGILYVYCMYQINQKTKLLYRYTGSVFKLPVFLKSRKLKALRQHATDEDFKRLLTQLLFYDRGATLIMFSVLVTYLILMWLGV